jgi:Protein of unknown function, DUF417
MTTTSTATNVSDKVPTTLMQVGQLVSRYGLVTVLLWIGFGKYVKMEARVLIEHSPFMSWIYDYLSVTNGRARSRHDGNRCSTSHCTTPAIGRLGGRQCAGRGAVCGHDQLLVHHADGGCHPRCGSACVIGAAGPIPAQGPGADGCGDLDAGRFASQFGVLMAQNQRRPKPMTVAGGAGHSVDAGNKIQRHCAAEDSRVTDRPDG